MNNQFKPNVYNSVSPYLMVDEVQQLLDMLKNVFKLVFIKQQPDSFYFRN